MSAEPEKFVVGVVDLLAVLLPCAVSVYLVKDTLGPRLINAYSTLPNTEAWAVFAVASSRPVDSRSGSRGGCSRKKRTARFEPLFGSRRLNSEPLRIS
jgi:hypothetical protein